MSAVDSKRFLGGGLGRLGLACLAGLALAAGIAIESPAVHEAGADEGPAGLRVAVARFTGESHQIPVSERLTEGLSAWPLDRLLGPEAFVGGDAADPEAAAIRQWAYNAAVDTVVHGTLRRTENNIWEIEAILRSGHSGAELARHVVAWSEGADIAPEMDQLAQSILQSLGHPDLPKPESGTARDPRSPEPARLVATPADSGDGGNGENEDSGGGLEAGFEFGGLQGDEPIEIKAEEAEIVDRDSGRKLVFRRNVSVRQGDVTLLSDRLDALYPKGESEPNRLVAEGHVSIEQGHRRAKCDRAIYERDAEQLFCIGHAELVQGCDIVRGNRIEFDLAGDQARVRGAASIVIRPGDAGARGCVAAGDLL